MALQNRMARELRTLEREPPDGVCVLLPDEANPLQLRARLQGPPGSPYEDGLFELDIRIPERSAVLAPGPMPPLYIAHVHRRLHTAAILPHGPV
jgi:ubiquitin-protein ligase